MYSITLDQILAIDGGERYMLSVYPELHECFANPHKKIKLRDDDKTASAGVFKHKTAKIWMLNDFGGGASDKALTAFTLCQNVNKCDSGEAFKILAKFYGIDLKVEQARPTYSSRMPKPGELPKQVLNIVYKELEAHEAHVIFSRYAWEAMQWNGKAAKDDKERLEMAGLLMKYYHFKPIASYEQVKSDGSIVHIYASNESFPMFAIDEGGFQKIYKPKAEKAYRFIWAGNKPEDFAHGLKQHTAYIESNIKANEKRKAEAEEHSEAAAAKESKKSFLPEKLQEIILVSGGSDALNVAALGYRVIWLNSESAKVNTMLMGVCRKIAINFYNLPDIDATGRNAARALAWSYLDVKTIWLPSELSNKPDGKGGYCKDVRDYLKYYKAESFKKLYENALPFKFWDEMPKTDKEGNNVFRFGRPQYVYEFNNVRGYNFLQMNGFWRYADAKYKEGYRLIKINDNIVSDVLPNEVKNFIHVFLKERQMPEDLRNVMFKSPQLSEASLSNLEEIKLDFKFFGSDFQYLFFENKTWKITKNKIEAVKMPSIYVLDKKILKPLVKGQKIEGFEPKVLEPFFSIKGKAEGLENWEVEFKNIDCDYLKFTLQSCKIHWKTELESRMEFFELSGSEQLKYVEENKLEKDLVEKMNLMAVEENQLKYKEKYRFSLVGSLLTEEEQAEQMLCFVNRCFLIGYILHRYKDPTKPWAGFVMDYRISDESASNGRAGKGLLAMGLKMLLDHYRIDARDPKLFDNTFIFGGVNKGNELIHMEDWDEFLDFERLFNMLTGALMSNAKGMQPVNIDNQDFGKFLIDTNFSDRYTSGSAKGRKLHTVFADYYHEDLEFYKEVRTPASELGRRMFDDWDNEEWNRFYNFMAQCLSFYLSVAEMGIKIDPPFSNILKRNSLAVMGENFRTWADTYFADSMDMAVERKPAFEDFVKATNNPKATPQSFLKKILAWCDFMGYKLNPQDVPGWQKAGDNKKYGYIKKSVASKNEVGKYTTVEYLYIRTSKGGRDQKKTDEMVIGNADDISVF
jgi:hypothetical protein